ncbi:hypothetical protein RND71_028626 [Anisodus tanguticus]|uniref:Uncharacterized protein n=1 Tax=Anisodus tanguticus TaxID=243964 RepID=A0AAE1V1S9_9SOLA|nr:hypothetical protein RND71_028626 [Anisodus tanguticus]
MNEGFGKIKNGEYERRIKNSRKYGVNNGDGEQIELFSSFSILAQEIKGSSSKIKMRLGEDWINYENSICVPQTEVALAAINGLFSA